MFVRFTTQETDSQSNSLQGIFIAIHNLRRENRLEPHEDEIAWRNLQWLAMHLKAPKILEEPEHYRAISWFKDTAREPIKRIRELIPILESHDIHIQMKTTDEPGIVIYEDGWQIAAKPRRGT